MNVTIRTAGPLTGSVAVPPDKAICQRAVLVAALSAAETRIRPWPRSDDPGRALALAEGLGVSVRLEGPVARLSGGTLRAPARPLFCGESGTTLRLAAGLLAGQPFRAELTGAPSLSARPMRRIVEPLERMGARIAGTTRPGSTDLHPPLVIEGRAPLEPITYTLPVASAQLKSAILLAGLAASGRTTVIEPRPTRDHTERLLALFGVPVRRADGRVSVEPARPVSPGEIVVPGDFSSAAFFLVAGCCVPGSSVTITGVGLNPTRTGILRVLTRMGAEIMVTEGADAWEPVGTVQVGGPSGLHATTVGPDEIPPLIDELPVLMVAAACARGATRIAGIGELRVKETDRIRSMAEGLTRLGARVRVLPEEALEIEGGGLRGAAVPSAGDHRTAMSLAIAGLLAQGETTIHQADCVGKSFPEFFDQLRVLAGPEAVRITSE